MLEDYKQEINIDVKVSQLDILDRQLMLPGLKHKWVSRLIDAKRECNRLNKKKKETRRLVLEALSKSIPSGLPKTALDAKIEATEAIQLINDQLDEAELLVEYLEKVEKIFSSMSFDFTNMVNLIKMETT